MDDYNRIIEHIHTLNDVIYISNQTLIANGEEPTDVNIQKLINSTNNRYIKFDFLKRYRGDAYNSGEDEFFNLISLLYEFYSDGSKDMQDINSMFLNILLTDASCPTVHSVLIYAIKDAKRAGYADSEIAIRLDLLIQDPRFASNSSYKADIIRAKDAIHGINGPDKGGSKRKSKRKRNKRKSKRNN
jgi:hypothetical protein